MLLTLLVVSTASGLLGCSGNLTLHHGKGIKPKHAGALSKNWEQDTTDIASSHRACRAALYGEDYHLSLYIFQALRRRLLACNLCFCLGYLPEDLRRHSYIYLRRLHGRTRHHTLLCTGCTIGVVSWMLQDVIHLIMTDGRLKHHLTASQ